MTRNTVEVAADGGDAISMIYQDRGTGRLGPWEITKDRVYQNKIVFFGARGAGGVVADYKIDKVVKDQTNQFERNLISSKIPISPIGSIRMDAIAGRSSSNWAASRTAA